MLDRNTIYSFNSGTYNDTSLHTDFLICLKRSKRMFSDEQMTQAVDRAVNVFRNGFR